ncbi:carbohydrate ABC transporter permease [Paenibacillus hamazuiensis]|uniref:carbohydrate ABC transporter permease n=1 Tax=Paenibacillus hamazuiensis TaxID=2936508 RepID=UPI00200BF97A|nr:carbohydrate ABC transporter permease [Paenibacillus hamazuiensis]
MITAVWALFSVLFVTQVYPLVWLLLYSFKSDEEILDGSFFSLPNKMLWSNYSNAFVSGNYLMSLFNSILVTGATLIVVVALGSMASYAMTRFKWRYGGLFMAAFMIGIMIPHQSVLLPLLILFKNMGILNTYLALILPYIAFAIPMAVFILSGFLRSIPYEMEESAFMDGASVYRLFFSIILPIMKPPIMTVVILTFISVWNEYIKASILVSSSELKTLPFGVYSFISQFSTNYGSMGAFLVMSAAPVVIFYFFMAQRITRGMVAGAVKG